MKKDLVSSQIELINEHGVRAHQLWLEGKIIEAESEMQKCWHVLPSPATDYVYAQNLSRGIVTFYRDTAQFDKALRWLEVMRIAYGSDEDPGVEFMAATVHLKSGDHDDAFRIFDSLYAEFGAQPFEGKDPAYLD